jgi:hypothetical protein
MLNKLIVGVLGLAVVVAGIAAFSAFTAQLINLEAHVEKEIELAAVKNCRQVPGDIICEEDTGDYGVVIPQELYDKTIELTLSRSFFEQDRWFDVTFDVLWECKQYDPPRDRVDNNTGLPVPDDPATPEVEGPGDGFDDCRPVEHPSAHAPNHPNGELDGRLRDYVQSVVADFNCIDTAQGPFGSRLPEEKDVELIGSGVIDKFNKKCFYAIKLLVPPCSDSFNAATDPHGPDVSTARTSRRSTVTSPSRRPILRPGSTSPTSATSSRFRSRVTA